ncbi:uncharacterized protein JCM15063_001114 [Sporobolomyces koalae]|uniref:uncharacterized protein n=1 Tax=Sporobolomyces koalae TaxID=500713 RepID=UPI00316DB2BF
MPTGRAASPPPTPENWARASPPNGWISPGETSAPFSPFVPFDSPASPQREQEATRSTRYVEGEADEQTPNSSISTLEPASSEGPVGLLLFTRRSSTSLSPYNEDSSHLPTHPLDLTSAAFGTVPFRRSSDSSSLSGTSGASRNTLSRRVSWSNADAAADPISTPDRPPSSISARSLLPPPSSSSVAFAAPSLGATQYSANRPLFTIEASPLIPTSVETTPGTSPESSVEFPSPSSFPPALCARGSLVLGPLESRLQDTSLRRPSYSIIALDEQPHNTPWSAQVNPLYNSPLRKSSSRFVRRFLRRILIVSAILAVLLVLVRHYNLLPHGRSLSSPYRLGSYKGQHAEGARSVLKPRNKTHLDINIEENEKLARVEGSTTVRDEVRTFREEQLWAEPEQDLRTLVAGPLQGHDHEATIIMIHGLSQTVERNSFLHYELGTTFPSVRWVMPQAPQLPISYHGGESHPAWFDIASFPWDGIQDSDETHLLPSIRSINHIIREEQTRLVQAERRKQRIDDISTPITGEDRAWASKRILLGGFSQGGIVTLLAGLTNEHQLGGLFVFSGMLTMRDILPELVRDLDRKDLPIWWGHGGIDPYLLESDAASSVESLRLSDPGLALTRVTYKTYPALAHASHRDEINDLAQWMNSSVGGVFVPSISSHQRRSKRMR